MPLPEPNPIFRLARLGLVIIEPAGQPDHYIIVRPASVSGTQFFNAGETTCFGGGGTTLEINAPPALLGRAKRGKWDVDISMAAAPGPGPVWFRERFPDLARAVQAIRDCFFGNRIDFQSESLATWRLSR